jgi:DNA-binding transcriptional ArsR family regulator
MHTLHPTLWRTCRAIANEQRLKLLYALFENGEQCVFELAEKTVMSESQASIHLRALNARGLILQRRRKMRVLYRAEANHEVESASSLLDALHTCYHQKIPIPSLIRQATAFTHPRRIEIIQCIPPSGTTKDWLSEKTKISLSALSRHLKKLKLRGFVTGAHNEYYKTVPKDAFSQAILQNILDTIRP